MPCPWSLPQHRTLCGPSCCLSLPCWSSRMFPGRWKKARTSCGKLLCQKGTPSSQHNLNLLSEGGNWACFHSEVQGHFSWSCCAVRAGYHSRDDHPSEESAQMAPLMRSCSSSPWNREYPAISKLCWLWRLHCVPTFFLTCSDTLARALTSRHSCSSASQCKRKQRQHWASEYCHCEPFSSLSFIVNFFQNSNIWGKTKNKFYLFSLVRHTENSNTIIKSCNSFSTEILGMIYLCSGFI